MLCSRALRGVPASVCGDNEDDLFFAEKVHSREKIEGEKDSFPVEIPTIVSFFWPFENGQI